MPQTLGDLIPDSEWTKVRMDLAVPEDTLEDLKKLTAYQLGRLVEDKDDEIKDLMRDLQRTRVTEKRARAEYLGQLYHYLKDQLASEENRIDTYKSNIQRIKERQNAQRRGEQPGVPNLEIEQDWFDKIVPPPVGMFNRSANLPDSRDHEGVERFLDEMEYN